MLPLRSRSTLSSVLLLFLALATAPDACGASAGAVPLIRVALVRDAAAVALGCDREYSIGRHHAGLRPTSARGVWKLRATDNGVELLDDRGSRRGSTADTLFVASTDPERSPLQVDGRAYRGELLIWSRPGGLCVVNVVDLESYLKGVLPIEMGPQPPERRAALEAQAVAARSYTMATMGRWRAEGFDLVATVDDQVYSGLSAEKPACTDAIEATRGVLAQFGGAPIHAYYSSTCGGSTASPVDVWGQKEVGYLRPVADRAEGVEDDFCDASPKHQWEETWKLSELDGMLDANLSRVRKGWKRSASGDLRHVRLVERFACGRAAILRLEFTKGSVDLRGDEIRWVLRRPGGKQGLNSCRLLEVEVDKGGRAPTLRVRGQGYGHGVGMCQYGAMGMASAGRDFRSILGFYYPGISLDQRY